METRWRWPPESFTPRSPTMVSYPFSKFSANSSTRAMRQASQDLLLGRVGPREGDVLADGAVEQERVLQHHAELRAVAESRRTVERSTPSTRTVPSVGAWNAAIRLMMVDLPEPDGPTSAVTVPGAERKLTSSSTGLPAS